MPKNHAIGASRIAHEPPVTIVGPTTDLQIYSSIIGAGEIIGRLHDHLASRRHNLVWKPYPLQSSTAAMTSTTTISLISALSSQKIQKIHFSKRMSSQKIIVMTCHHQHLIICDDPSSQILIKKCWCQLATICDDNSRK